MRWDRVENVFDLTNAFQVLLELCVGEDRRGGAELLGLRSEEEELEGSILVMVDELFALCKVGFALGRLNVVPKTTTKGLVDVVNKRLN